MQDVLQNQNQSAQHQRAYNWNRFPIFTVCVERWHLQRGGWEASCGPERKALDEALRSDSHVHT